MKRSARLAGLLAVALTAGSTIAFGAGFWSTLPGIGFPSYCASTVTGTGNLGGLTGQGQGTIGSICGQTVPAGPATFTGNEYAPFDLNALGTNSQAGGPNTANVSIEQLGQGPMLDVTAPATATIPANTPFYFLDGAQASAFTITMPAAPIEGYIQRIVCESATVGALTIAGNSGQTVKNSPGAACVAGTAYAFRYQASNTTWYKF